MPENPPPLDAEELADYLKHALLNSTCTDKCHKIYLDTLKKCKGDLECIERATGRYVLCVYGCRRHP